jgi:hypothetical protein
MSPFEGWISYTTIVARTMEVLQPTSTSGNVIIVK